MFRSPTQKSELGCPKPFLPAVLLETWLLCINDCSVVSVEEKVRVHSILDLLHMCKGNWLMRKRWINCSWICDYQILRGLGIKQPENSFYSTDKHKQKHDTKRCESKCASFPVMMHLRGHPYTFLRRRVALNIGITTSQISDQFCTAAGNRRSWYFFLDMLLVIYSCSS